MKNMAILTLGLIAAVLHLPAAEIPVNLWQVVGPFLDASREMDLDLLAPYGGEEKVAPAAGQVFYALQPEGGILRWFEVSAGGPDVRIAYPNTRWDHLHKRYGSNERSEGYANVGYAYAELEVQERTRVLIFTRSVPTLWLNGIRMDGEYYAIG